jgi:nucleoside-diphosphate-sugar epimerase
VEILITGANGLLGRHVIATLQGRGDTIRALVLPGEDTTWLEERGVAVFRGDVRCRDTLVEPMRGAEGVLNLAGMMGLWRPLREYEDVNVKGLEHVCREALAAGVRRLVHISSWRVYGSGKWGVYTSGARRPWREDEALRPFPEPYSVTKAKGEAVVRRLVAEEGLRAVVIRPGTFFGPGDQLHFGHLADRLRSGVSLMIGSGRNALPFVYVADVAEGVVLALDRENAVGQTYNITSDEVMTQEELLRAVAEEIGAKPPAVRVPYSLLYAAAFAAEHVAVIPGYAGNPAVTRMGVTLFGADNRHSIEKARAELGYSPRMRLREGVRLAAAWYREQRKLGQRADQVANEPARGRLTDAAAD